MTNNKKAVSLIEIVIASLILVMAIIPLMTMSRSDATTAVETEKIQMAEKVLGSVKAELMTMPFRNFAIRAEAEKLDPNSAGPFELSDGYYPTAFNQVLSIQQKYKDFQVVGTWSYVVSGDNKVDKTMVEAEVCCSFSRPGAVPIERRKAFLIVKP